MTSLLTVESYGTVGHPVLCFIHGWPDTAAIWQQQVTFFKDRHHCLTVTLPNFPGAGESKWGLDFIQLTDLLAESIGLALKDSPKKSVTVIGHDWGAILSYLLDQRHPELIERVVTLDVGAQVKPSSFSHLLFLVSYQCWLALAFLIGHLIPPIGNQMTAWFSDLVHAPRRRNVTSQMNYFYYYAWRGILFKKYRNTILRRYRPTKPTLFLYGVRNKYYFYTPRWIDLVKATPNGRVEAMSRSDHWITMREPEKTNSVINEWLQVSTC